VLLWSSWRHKLFRGRVHCASDPGLPGLYQGGKLFLYNVLGKKKIQNIC